MTLTSKWNMRVAVAALFLLANASAYAQATRTFAAYWRMIYPGSALIRVMWLRAIRLRAEA